MPISHSNCSSLPPCALHRPSTASWFKRTVSADFAWRYCKNPTSKPATSSANPNWPSPVLCLRPASPHSHCWLRLKTCRRYWTPSWVRGSCGSGPISGRLLGRRASSAPPRKRSSDSCRLRSRCSTRPLSKGAADSCCSTRRRCRVDLPPSSSACESSHSAWAFRTSFRFSEHLAINFPDYTWLSEAKTGLAWPYSSGFRHFWTQPLVLGLLRPLSTTAGSPSKSTANFQACVCTGVSERCLFFWFIKINWEKIMMENVI